MSAKARGGTLDVKKKKEKEKESNLKEFVLHIGFCVSVLLFFFSFLLPWEATERHIRDALRSRK